MKDITITSYELLTDALMQPGHIKTFENILPEIPFMYVIRFLKSLLNNDFTNLTKLEIIGYLSIAGYLSLQ